MRLKHEVAKECANGCDAMVSRQGEWAITRRIELRLSEATQVSGGEGQERTTLRASPGQALLQAGQAPPRQLSLDAFKAYYRQPLLGPRHAILVRGGLTNGLFVDTRDHEAMLAIRVDRHARPDFH